MDDVFLLSDGLIVTLVAMIVVFVILAAIWGLMELVHKCLPENLAADQSAVSPENLLEPHLLKDEKREIIAALAALIRAHEEHPAKKYEIIEVKRLR